jgi:hypothetical protein
VHSILWNIPSRHATEFSDRLNPDLGNFVQTIYKRAFKPQKVQAKQVATQLRQLQNEASRDLTMEKGRHILLSLSQAMLGQTQLIFEPPNIQATSRRKAEMLAADSLGMYAEPIQTPCPISLAMVRLHVKGDPRGEMAYESHVHTEAKLAAVLVRLLEKACGKGDDIFVACPHRIQRAAVNLALSQWDMREKEETRRDNDEDEELQQLIHNMGIEVEEANGNAFPKVSLFTIALETVLRVGARLLTSFQLII